jgi:arsenite oxidase small subunit
MAKDDKGTGNSKEKPATESDEGRRDILKVGLGVGAVFVIGGIGAIARSLINPGIPETASTTQTETTTTASGSSSAPPAATPNFPVVQVANLKDVQEGTPINFNYPLQSQPNFLIKLGVKAEGGVGPDGDIVAFSQICQHLGCVYGFVATDSSPTCNASYKASGPVGYCCCHGSVYDLGNGAKVIGGPAPRPVPQVILYYDGVTGNIWATGMTPPTVFGFDTGSSDVSQDLQGGTLV